MTRYQATELTDTGYGRRFYAERLKDLYLVVDTLGGQWRIRRQSNWTGRWSKDGGRAEWIRGQ